MGLKLVAGRWFDANRPADDTTLDFPIARPRRSLLPSAA